MGVAFLQGWSCCKKRSTDFTDFLNIPVSGPISLQRFAHVIELHHGSTCLRYGLKKIVLSWVCINSGMHQGVAQSCQTGWTREGERRAAWRGKGVCCMLVSLVWWMSGCGWLPDVRWSRWRLLNPKNQWKDPRELLVVYNVYMLRLITAWISQVDMFFVLFLYWQ